MALIEGWISNIDSNFQNPDRTQLGAIFADMATLFKQSSNNVDEIFCFCLLSFCEIPLEYSLLVSDPKRF